MSDSTDNVRKPSRLKRLMLLLAAVATVWGVVAAIRQLLPPSALSLARAAVVQGQFKEAVEQYQRHLDQDPEDWGARGELGRVLAEIDRPRALAELRQVPPESEVYLDVRQLMVSICMASERFQEAEQILLELNEKSPDDFVVQLTLAQLYFQQHRAQAALPFAQKSVQLKPDDAAAQFLLAELLDDLGRTSEMIEPLKRVVALDVENYAAHLNLAYAYAEAGQSAESGREADWCLARNPNEISARRYRALAARDQGQVEEATKEIERALALAPDDLPCRLLEAELLLFQQQPERALQRLKPLYATHANDRRLPALLARAAAAAGLDEEAAAYRQQVQKLSEK